MRALQLLTTLGWLWIFALISLAVLGFDVRRHHFEAGGIAFGICLASAMWSCRADSRPSAERSAAAQPFWVGACAASVALCAFGWSATVGPLSDDFVLRSWAAAGELAPSEWSYLRPLPLLMWQGVGRLGGDWTALHALNIVAHALNAVLVARIGVSWNGVAAGLAAGALFATFPASVEAVAWTAGVFDVTATACVLGAVALSAQPPLTATRLGVIAALTLAGLLCKETAIATPLLLCLSFIVSRRAWSLENVRHVWLSAAICLSYLLVRAATAPIVASHAGNLPSGRREWKDWLVRPFSGVTVPMRTDEGMPVIAYVAGCLLLALLAIALLGSVRPALDAAVRRGAVSLWAGLTWIGVAASPLLLSFYVAPNLEGSRYLYLPAAGYALALSSALGMARSDRARGLAAAFLVALMSVFASRINVERHHWFAAAAVRDAVLREALVASKAQSCRSVSVLDAPDNLSGVFVFRVGLPEALASLAVTTESGLACVWRWNGRDFIPVPPS